MPGVAAKALLVAALLAAPGAAVQPPPAPLQSPRPRAVRPQPPGQLSLSALGDLALPETSAGFAEGRDPAMVERWWAAVRTWAANWLDRQGTASASGLHAAAHRVDPGLDLQVVPLGSQAYLVSADRSGHGNVFIVAPREGRMRVPWTISALDPAARRAFPALASWSADAVVNQGCGAEPCAAIGVHSISTLPRGPNGAARFFISGSYFSEAGATQGGHLAIWEWDGRRARPLFAGHYNYLAGQSLPVLVARDDGFLLNIKGDYRYFFACGQCEGRQMVWRLRMTPDGVRDLGRTSRTPEVDFMDRLAGRLLRNESVADIADPAPAAFFKRQVQAAASLGSPSPGETPLVGMMGYWQATRSGNLTRLCFNADDVNGMFTLTGHGQHMRLVAARPIASNACDRRGAHL